VRFIVDSFRTVHDVRPRATPGRLEFEVGASVGRRGLSGEAVRCDLARVIAAVSAAAPAAVAGGALKRRVEAIEQGGDFGRLEHHRLDEQCRADPRHERGVVLDELLDRLPIAVAFAGGDRFCSRSRRG